MVSNTIMSTLLPQSCSVDHSGLKSTVLRKSHMHFSLLPQEKKEKILQCFDKFKATFYAEVCKLNEYTQYFPVWKLMTFQYPFSFLFGISNVMIFRE